MSQHGLVSFIFCLDARKYAPNHNSFDLPFIITGFLGTWSFFEWQSNFVKAANRNEVIQAHSVEKGLRVVYREPFCVKLLHLVLVLLVKRVEINILLIELA